MLSQYKFISIFLFLLVVALFVFLVKSDTQNQNGNKVVVYVSHDQDYAQPILEQFEKESKIKVRAVYDTEASKTVGLVNRLIAEKNNPQADVFWNNEVVRTIQLKKEGILDIYKPKNYDKLSPVYKDPDGYWTGFAARARVLLLNQNQIKDAKRVASLEDLLRPEFKDKVTIADPRFGTTGSHLAALFAVWGKEKAKKYFLDLKANGLDIAQSNGQTRDKIVEGIKSVGFTDTDDANDALVKKKPVMIVYPDQNRNQMGTLVIPNTAMLIKGAKNLKNAKTLIDYLISEKTEEQLAKAKSAQMPLLPKVKIPDNIPAVETIKPLNVSWEKIHDNLKTTIDFFEDEMLK
jgi:iron(III) transport system substrate-binding protein